MKKIWKIFVGVIFLAVCSGCGIKKEQKKTIADTKEKIYRDKKIPSRNANFL